jgi:Plavaka transposase
MDDDDDVDRPLAQRRNRREDRRLPKRYRDVEPEPPAPLPPAPSQVLPECVQVEPEASRPQYQLLKTLRDGFGFFRQYYAIKLPEHDTLQHSSSNGLIESSPDSLPVDIYHPYPNQSSFLLGEWYWNGGEKKSQSSFRNLLQIVGHPSFCPEDVSGKNWRLIDAKLSGERLDDVGPNKQSKANKRSKANQPSEANKQSKEGWIQTPVKINVPFHSRMLHPGPKYFDAGVLHHRRLISVIKEKITQTSASGFQFEPYELFWQPSDTVEPIRVYGELYTSEAFFEAHRTLQDSPREPDCQLPRIVLGLMFASDPTHLTAFSTKKLCPIYLAIGNESKDQRHAFEHVAYLETVSEVRSLAMRKSSILLNGSFLTLSNPLRQRILAEKESALPLWHIASEKSSTLNGQSFLTMNS